MGRILVVPTVVTLVALASPLPAAAQQTRPPGPGCRDYGSPAVRICVELDREALKGLGRSTTWRVRVEGARRSIDLRVHNVFPSVVRLEGGNDQIVRVGGWRRREVRRRVTSVGGGSFQITATPYDPSPEKESARIAEVIAPHLGQIAAEFAERRDRLPGAPDYPSGAVVELLASTRARLMEVLSYPELAALRDYVEEEFRRAHRELRGSRDRAAAAVVASLAVPSPAWLTPALQPGGGTIPKERADPVLDRLLAGIRRLHQMATANDMITTLCVVSAPGGKAKFFMRPRSYDERHETSTIGSISGIYRGLYVYSIAKGRRKVACEDPDAERCAPLNLIDDPSPIFHCDLDARACKRMPGPLPEPCRGTRP